MDIPAYWREEWSYCKEERNSIQVWFGKSRKGWKLFTWQYLHECQFKEVRLETWMTGKVLESDQWQKRPLQREQCVPVQTHRRVPCVLWEILNYLQHKNSKETPSEDAARSRLRWKRLVFVPIVLAYVYDLGISSQDFFFLDWCFYYQCDIENNRMAPFLSEAHVSCWREVPLASLMVEVIILFWTGHPTTCSAILHCYVPPSAITHCLASL